MIRVNGFSAINRAIVGSAVASARVCNHRCFLPSASYCTASVSREGRRFNFRQPKKSITYGFTGAVLFSVASATLVQDAHASESVFAPKEVVLYQFEACPFCNKVKAFLDYYRIPYKIVEVNPITKKEIKWSEYKKVPILTVDGEHMEDSSAIIDKLFLSVHPEKSHDVTRNDEEAKWRGWVDNHLVHILSPNIYRSSSEAIEAFDYITRKGNFGYAERIFAKYAGATAMYFVSKRLKKKHNITDERASLYEAAETWVNALNGRKFLGGENPNLADLAVFGVLKPIRYLKAGNDMVEHTPLMGEWYGRMETAIGDSKAIPN